MTEGLLALDCAGTLYYPRSVTNPDNLVPGVGFIVGAGGGFQPIIRPSAQAFLEQFAARRQIITFGLTGGSSTQAIQSLSVCKLLGKGINNVIGVNDRIARDTAGKFGDKFVLIDDSPASDRTTQSKLAFLSGKKRADFDDAQWCEFLDRHFIHITTWSGVGDDPQPLTNFTEKVLSLLGA